MSKESCQPSSFKCSSTSPFMGVITMTGSLCGPQNSLQSLAVKHQWSTQLLFGPFIKVGKWPKQQVKMTPKKPFPNSRALWGGVNLSFFQKRLNAPFDKDPEGTEKKTQLNSMKNSRFRQSSKRRELGESYGILDFPRPPCLYWNYYIDKKQGENGQWYEVVLDLVSCSTINFNSMYFLQKITKIV